MKNNVVGMVRSSAAFGRRNLRRFAVPVVAAGMVGISSAADTGNTGVAEIVTALNGLKPDMGTVIVAAIGIAIIGMGAVAAISLGKRLMGK